MVMECKITTGIYLCDSPLNLATLPPHHGVIAINGLGWGHHNMAKGRATGAVSGAVMAIFGGGRAEISHDKNANGGGEGAVGGFGLGDEGADLMHGELFAPADIAEPIPHFRFQPDRGAVAINGYITAQKDAFGCYGGQAGSKHEKHHN